MTTDASLQNLATTLLAMGMPATDVIDILLANAWTTLFDICRTNEGRLSETFWEMARQVSIGRLKPATAKMALEPLGIDPLLVALHAPVDNPRDLSHIEEARFLARSLGVEEVLAARIGDWRRSRKMYFPCEGACLGLDLEGFSPEVVHQTRESLRRASQEPL